MTNKKILGIFANHTSNILKYNISLNNIILLKEHLTNIIIIDSKNEIYANKLKNDLVNENKIINYLFLENDNYFDFGKWINALKITNYKEYSQYDYIVFINDSIIITHEINNYFIQLNNLEHDVNLYGYNDSTQIKYHYQTYLFAVNYNIIEKFISFFEDRKHLIIDLDSLVHTIEINICELDENRDCFIKIGNEYNMTKNIFWENEILYKYLLSRNIFAIIKLKKIFYDYKNYKLTIYGNRIPDFDYDFYRSYYEDLTYLSNKQLLEHYIKYGQYEGRRFTKKSFTLLPDYYRNKLDSIGMLYFFDVPIDFDVYYYKKNYSDVENLSIIQTYFHYINEGFYQARTYNKDSNTNIYLNNFYLNIIQKYKKINTVNIPNNFSIYSYMTLNNIEYKDTFKDIGYLGIFEYYTLNYNNNRLHTVNDINKIICNLDYKIYKDIYPNLNKFTNNELLEYYINNEKDRKIYKLPNDFNISNYKKIYSDLAKLSNKDIEIHYILYGVKQNRIYKLPSDFNPSFYKELYPELSKLTDKQLADHYLFEGIKNKKIYKVPDDFDLITYKKIYTNLQYLSDIQIKEDYVLEGQYNNRIYKIPEDFDHTTYRKIYNLEDLTIKEL